jgi:hypothetical protein
LSPSAALVEMSCISMPSMGTVAAMAVCQVFGVRGGSSNSFLHHSPQGFCRE